MSIPFYASSASMLDRMSASVPVHFFGSSKVGKVPYLLTHAYEVCMDEIDDFARTVLKVEEILVDETINLTYELSLGFSVPKIGEHATWLKKRHMNYRLGLESKIQRINDGIFQTHKLLLKVKTRKSALQQHTVL